MPVVFLLESGLGIGTFGCGAVGDAFWFGAGVGEPKLSYCSCCADAISPLNIRATAAVRIARFVFMFGPCVVPADQCSGYKTFEDPNSFLGLSQVRSLAFG